MGGTSRVPFTYFWYIDNVRAGTRRKSRMHRMVVAVPLKAMVFRTGLIAWWVLGLCGVILLGGGCASSSPAKGKESSPTSSIGVVDTKWLLAESKLGKQVTESLNQFMKDRQALIELEQKELRGLESELLRQGSVLNPSAKQQREERFRQRMVEYQGKVANLNLEVQKKQAELFGEFRSSVDTVVAKVAQRHGLVLVLEKGENSPTRYHQPSLNISKEVLEEMDREVQ